MRLLFIRGWGGFAAFLLLGAAGAGGTGIGIALGGAESGGNWGTVVGFALASVVLWFGGRVINDRPKTVYDPVVDAPVTWRNRHRLLGLPIQYVAPLPAGVAIVVAVLLLTR